MLNILTLIKGAFSNNKGAVAEKIGTALDGLITNKEELLLAKVEMQKVLNEQQKVIIENELKEIEVYLKDSENARNRELEINKSQNSSWLAKNTTSILAVVTVFLTFVLFYIMVFTKMITPERKELFIYILGVLSTICAGIMNYYFGSSKGSNDKSDTINKMINNDK